MLHQELTSKVINEIEKLLPIVLTEAGRGRVAKATLGKSDTEENIRSITYYFRDTLKHYEYISKDIVPEPLTKEEEELLESREGVTRAFLKDLVILGKGDKKGYFKEAIVCYFFYLLEKKVLAMGLPTFISRLFKAE